MCIDGLDELVDAFVNYAIAETCTNTSHRKCVGAFRFRAER